MPKDKSSSRYQARASGPYELPIPSHPTGSDPVAPYLDRSIAFRIHQLYSRITFWPSIRYRTPQEDSGIATLQWLQNRGVRCHEFLGSVVPDQSITLVILKFCPEDATHHPSYISLYPHQLLSRLRQIEAQYLSFAALKLPHTICRFPLDSVDREALSIKYPKFHKHLTHYESHWKKPNCHRISLPSHHPILPRPKITLPSTTINDVEDVPMPSASESSSSDSEIDYTRVDGSGDFIMNTRGGKRYSREAKGKAKDNSTNSGGSTSAAVYVQPQEENSASQNSASIPSNHPITPLPSDNITPAVPHQDSEINTTTVENNQAHGGIDQHGDGAENDHYNGEDEHGEEDVYEEEDAYDGEDEEQRIAEGLDQAGELDSDDELFEKEQEDREREERLEVASLD